MARIADWNKIVAKATAGTFVLQLWYLVFGFIISVFLSRLVGAEGFGTFTFATSWVGLLGIPTTFGLNQLLVREVAVYNSQKNWGLVRGILKWSNLLVLGASLFFGLLAIVITYLTTFHQNRTLFYDLCIAFSCLPFFALISLRQAVMKGFHDIVRAQMPELALQPLLFLGFCWVAYLLLKSDITTSWILAAHVVSMAIAYGVGSRLLTQILPKEIHHTNPLYEIRPWLDSAIPFMLVGSMQMVYNRIDIILLGILSTQENVGVYAIANKLAQLICLGLMVFNRSLGPAVATLYAEGKLQQLQSIITRTTRYIFLLSVPVTLVLVIGAQPILAIAGPEFTRGSMALMILCVGQLGNALTGSVGILLNMCGYERYTAWTIAISVTLNAILDLLLIPSMGINGAAIATTTSLLLANVLKVIWVQNKIGIDTSIFGLKKKSFET